MISSAFIENIYVGDDGKLHKLQGGADSVLPFNSGYEIPYFTVGKHGSSNASANLKLNVYGYTKLAIGSAYVKQYLYVEDSTGNNIKTYTSSFSTEQIIDISNFDEIRITIVDYTSSSGSPYVSNIKVYK